tara:strand:+ start:1457 stop:1825 length:369 start_codon:yes stop_codon:yes gene_type:complete
MKSKINKIRYRLNREFLKRGPFLGFKLGFLLLIGIHLKPIYDNAVAGREYWHFQYCGEVTEGCKYWVGSTLDYMLRTPSSFDYNMGYSLHHYIVIGCLIGLIFVYLLEIRTMLNKTVYTWGS